MKGNEYQKLAARTINKELTNIEQERHALLGLASEVGELHGLYQKAYQGHPLDDEYVKKEAGDCLWMIAELCTANGWELEEIMQMNIDKLKARYPEGFSEEKSLNRKDGDI
jgi:NTP pyrophosphatase (non-canonical NTP hydrolase)